MATAESKHADEAAAAAAATVPPVTSVEPTRPYLMELAASMQQQASAQPSVEANAQQIEDALMATAGDQAGRRGPLSRTSKFKGVTRHRRSGRWEAHVWVKETGKQAYLGGYASEEEAAEAHDVAALKCHGLKAKTNFHISRYAALLDCVRNMGMDELVMAIRRRSQGFTRGSSSYRGVTQHKSAAGRWEVRIGLPGGRHVYLGLHSTEPEAARVYDRALVLLAGPAAATNFPTSNYAAEMDLFLKRQQHGEAMFDDKNERAFESWLRGIVFKEATPAAPSSQAPAAAGATAAQAALAAVPPQPTDAQPNLVEQVIALSAPPPLVIPPTSAGLIVPDLSRAVTTPAPGSTAGAISAPFAPSAPSLPPEPSAPTAAHHRRVKRPADGNESEVTQSEDSAEGKRPAKRRRQGKRSGTKAGKQLSAPASSAPSPSFASAVPGAAPATPVVTSAGDVPVHGKQHAGSRGPDLGSRKSRKSPTQAYNPAIHDARFSVRPQTLQPGIAGPSDSTWQTQSRTSKQKDGPPDVVAAARILMHSRNEGADAATDSMATAQNSPVSQQTPGQQQGSISGPPAGGFELRTLAEKLALWLCLLCAVGSLTHATLQAAASAERRKVAS